jgi:branched-chain amino acid transport system substrate-binding protein
MRATSNSAGVKRADELSCHIRRRQMSKTNNPRKAISVLLIRLLLLSAAIVLGFMPTETMAQQVRIGFAAPLTGPYASLGNEMHQAAKDAIKAINEAGGLFGQKVELVVFDDRCDPNQAIRVANELAGRRVDAVIGHCPRTAPVVAHFYEASKTIFISTLTSNRHFAERCYRYVFHLGMSEDRMGEAAAAAIAKEIEEERFPGKTVGIVRDGRTFSRGVASTLDSQLRARGAAIVFNEDLLEPSTFLYLLDKRKPDILFFAACDPALILQLFRNQAPKTPIVALGLPTAPEESWDQFWRWVEKNRVEAYVFAPSAMGGPRPGITPHTPLYEIRNIWGERISKASNPPTVEQVYVFTAFDLLTQIIRETRTTKADTLDAALRSVESETLLGRLQSGEKGEIKPIPYRLYRGKYHGDRVSYQWKPSTAFLIECCTGAGPLKAAKGAREPVYNIEVDPKESKDPLVLKPNQKTKVIFYIGPFSEESVAPGIEPSPLLKALAKKEPIELTVTLFCYLSETDTYQQRKIMFDPVKGRSDPAYFEILPSPAAVRDNNLLGELTFVVDASGMEIDVIKLHAFVGEPSREALEKYRPPAKLALGAVDVKEVSMPDLIISIAPQGYGKLPVIIRPIQDELKAHFRAALNDPKGESWIFESGLTKSDLDGLVSDVYMALREIVEQKNEDLQRIYKHLGEGVSIGPGGSLLKFTDTDYMNMLDAIRRKGANLYWRLFLRGDVELRKTMKALDSFDKQKRLRVRMLTAEVYAPWQILYPEKTGAVDPNKFWGFRYELGRLQLVDSAQGRTKTLMVRPKPDEVLFATWRRTGPKDEVADRAAMLVEHIKGKIGGGIAVSDKRDDFVSRIQSGSKKIKLIFAYGHGSSGSELLVYESESGNKVVIKAPNVVGPCLIFATDEFLTPGTLDDLNPGSGTHFLESQPIVILNACETGTAGTRAAGNNGFVGALTRSGARAIFVTEGPVWANFAHHFGQDLIDAIFAGEEARKALLDARLKHLREWKNPLGLLYALYGNAGARIKD